MDDLNASERGTKTTVIALALVSFFLALNYFVLAALKETLLITAPEAGVEVIPFVKVWLLFPVSVLFLVIFTWTATRVSYRFTVSGAILFFLCTYAVFTFFFFPRRESLHLYGMADQLQRILPEGWWALAAVVRYWSYTFFYVVAECWCTMIYSVVFWGYANAVMKFAEAKKYYPYLTLAGVMASLVAGPLTIFFTGESALAFVGKGSDPWVTAFYALTIVVLLSGISALFIFLRFCPAVPKASAPKPGKSFLAMFGKILRSKYLVTLAGVCLAYNLVISLTEVVWKNEVFKLYPEPAAFTAYLSKVFVMTGLVSTALTLFVCRHSLRRNGWTFTALITPVVALVTGVAFFYAIFSNEYGLSSFSLTAIPLMGSIHICLSCGAKYTLFDPCKEMAFTPLSPEEKLHGKAAIDGVGSRLGKTSSSMIYHLLLLVFPSITACTSVVGLVLMVAIFGCIAGILSLGRQMEQLPAEA